MYKHEYLVRNAFWDSSSALVKAFGISLYSLVSGVVGRMLVGGPERIPGEDASNWKVFKPVGRFHGDPHPARSEHQNLLPSVHRKIHFTSVFHSLQLIIFNSLLNE